MSVTTLKTNDLTHLPLDSASRWMDRIIYATQEQKDASLLTFVVSHCVEAFNTVPRLLVTSREPLSGKTTVLDAGSYLCQNPWWSNATSYALRAKFNEPDNRPTCIFDEISKIFGESGLRGHSNPLYQILVEGYRKSASLSMSVDRVASETSSYGVAICAGLKTAAPKDLRTRSIIIEMKPAPENVYLEDSLDSGIEAQGRQHGKILHSWVRSHMEELKYISKNVRRFHPKLRGRKAQIWGPLFAVAEIAGGDWPLRCLQAFTALALDANEKPILSTEEQILMDAAEYIRRQETMPRYLLSAELLAYLNTRDNETYDAQSDRQMAMLMSAALDPADTLTLPGHKTAKGWHVKAVMRKAEALETLLAANDADEVDEDEFDRFFEEETTETTVTTVA